MTRAQLILLSVVDCAFGLLFLKGPVELRTSALVINVSLATLLAILTGQDLMRRGLRLGWLVGLSYVAAPLLGLILYAIFSGRPVVAAVAPSS